VPYWCVMLQLDSFVFLLFNSLFLFCCLSHVFVIYWLKCMLHTFHIVCN